ncbi:MAG: hypothetical protein ACPGQS_03785 [Bradymonadia bacterium]
MDSELRLLARRYGDLTEAQLNEVDAHCRETKKDFVSAAFELGLLTEMRCLELVRVASGVSVVSLEHHRVSDAVAIRVDETVCRECRVLPIHVFRTTLVVASSQVDTRYVVQRLRERTGLNVRVQYGISTLIDQKLDEMFPQAPVRSSSISSSASWNSTDSNAWLRRESESSPGRSQRVVAILESDEDSITDFKMTFDKMPVDTAYFDSGKPFIDYVNGHQVDLILLGTTDVGMNTLEVCRLLKSDRSTQEVPIILLSSLIKEREWQRHTRARLADEFFEKPFDVMQLALCAESYLNLPPQWIDVSINEESLDSSISHSSGGAARLMQPAGEMFMSQPQSQIELSLELEKHGEIAQSLEVLREAADLNPQDFKLQSELARFYERHGSGALAMDAWQNAMMAECSPEEAEDARKEVRRLRAQMKA